MSVDEDTGWLKFQDVDGLTQSLLQMALRTIPVGAGNVTVRDFAVAISARVVIVGDVGAVDDIEQNPGLDDYVAVLCAPAEMVALVKKAFAGGIDCVVDRESDSQHFCEVVASMLRHDVLLPKWVLNELCNPRQPTSIDAMELSLHSREILKLLADGCSRKQISERIGYSERTAQRRISNLYAVLGVTDRAGAIAWARSSGVLH